MGYCYLIKFEQKLHHTEYYIGYSEEHPSTRYKVHKSGGGARLLQVLNEKGIDYYIVRIWKSVDRNFERKLKRRKKSRMLDKQLSYLSLE